YDVARTADLDLFAKYYRLMAEEGIYLPPSQFEGMFLSTAHTEEHIEKTIQAFHTVFEKLAR
ncbi:MAG: aspartate aminotransferase family protein, partial [Psychrobacillus sp.]